MLYLETLPAKLDSKTKYYTTKHNQRSKIKIRIWTKPQINVKRDSRKILKFNIKRDSRKILKFNIKRDSRKILKFNIKHDSRKILKFNIKRDSRKILITKLQLKFPRE